MSATFDAIKSKNMHLKKTVLLISLFASIINLNAQLQKTTSIKQKVVFIIVDGIAYDMIVNNPSPRLDEIAGEGSITQAYVGGLKEGYSETPTISAVGYNSLLTGVWANKHNVWGNSIKDPNYNYPTIFRLFKDQYPNGKTAVFSTWLDNRTKLIGEGLDQTRAVEVDYKFDGYELDTIRFPHDAKREYIKKIDALVAKEAAFTIKTQAPDLSWVYLEYSDDMGHGYGDSPQLTAAIKYEDSLIGSIYDAVKFREQSHQEDWLFLVTTDHGRSPKDGKHHGGQTDRERSTWIVTNSKNTNTYFDTQIPAIVDLLPTMTRFLNIDVAKDIRSEWDGVSLIDPVDFINVQAEVLDNRLHLEWENLGNKNTQVSILTTNTNDKKLGGKDNYTKIGQTSLGSERFDIVLKKGKKLPVKILLQTENTTQNVWIISNN